MRRAHRCAGKPTRHLARARVPDLEAAWPALEDERVVDGAHGPLRRTNDFVLAPATVDTLPARLRLPY